jgi:hypothetical protein
MTTPLVLYQAYSSHSNLKLRSGYIHFPLSIFNSSNSNLSSGQWGGILSLSSQKTEKCSAAKLQQSI